MNLVPVTEIPVKYQTIFHSFPYFNIVQSTVFEDAFYTDKSLVVCAPTGSGKTVVFELCIIRLLILMSDQKYSSSKYKIVYMAPVKSLCNERYHDWKSKFEPLGVLCIQLTGDSDSEDYFELQKYSLILTTPEKWDSVTRLWRNNKVLIQMVKLLLIDEIHLLNEEERGATMEATLSRMKTIHLILSCNSNTDEHNDTHIRFVAASATFPNAEDVAKWLSTHHMKGIYYKLNENLRPVSLRKVVLGYPYDSKSSEFKFDLMLSYKLNHVIQTYSENKPTLVFCSTRKSVMQTASVLSKTVKFVADAAHKVVLMDAANKIHDLNLRDCILNGIGFHHGGLDVSDRRLLENMFLNSQLLVLVSTSTLSMGVNFPAHLVVIKSTSQYCVGCYKEYSDTQMLQMIGRAGRPQFDKHATAVIMTKSSLQAKYEALVNGTQLIESSLHKHMAEHLNAEVALHSITDISIAMEWLKATFLYQRVFKNPRHYGMNADLSEDRIERNLQDICIKELNGLRKYQLISMDDDGFYLQPTKTGQLMAKYYIAYETMKQFYSLSGKENLAEMLNIFSSCKEFDDIQLRVSEKRTLNDLNKSKLSSVSLIQASFGCLTISDPSLNQDAARLFKNAQRISNCLVSYLMVERKGFAALHSAVILSKCFKARLWENSKFVSRQLEKIGVTFSNLLVNAGITTIEGILKTNPREIELILKRNPPFGNGVIECARQIPRFCLQVEQNSPLTSKTSSISITVELQNIEDVFEAKNQHNQNCYILIGDKDNKIVLAEKIRIISFFQERFWTKKIIITRAKAGELIKVYVISDTFVGVDVCNSYSMQYSSSDKLQNIDNKLGIHDREKQRENSDLKTINRTFEKRTRNCNHKCVNKGLCSHSCCKVGVAVPPPKKSKISSFMEQLQNKIYDSPQKVNIGLGIFSENFKTFERNNSNNIMQSDSDIISKDMKISSEEDILHENIDNYNFSSDESRDKEESETTECDKEIRSKIYFKANHFGEDILDKLEKVTRTKENASEVSNYQNMKFVPKLEIFPNKHQKTERWEDPVAAEQTFNMCLNFLSNCY